MFTRKMLLRADTSRPVRPPLSPGSRRWLRFVRFVVLGIVLSIVLNSWATSPGFAQRLIPNDAAVEYNRPTAGGTAINREGKISNEVIYPLSAVLQVDPQPPTEPPEPPEPPTPPALIPILEITKTANKSAAEPGDIVIYELLIKNKGTGVANNLQVVDSLPLGVQLVEDSIVGTLTVPPGGPSNSTELSINRRDVEDIDDLSVEGTLEENILLVEGRDFGIAIPALAVDGSLELTYAARITPDAIRGNGRNIAQASAIDAAGVDDAFQLTIRDGILSDCGTLIGRVFVDKNFDGHQQPGEPGVPNAVVYLESGNRIITDPDGLFSMANVLAGNRVGTLDLSSLPGYTLAPNLFRVEENSQSRLVRLAPGGLARMNFAVTPAFGEGEG